MPIECVYTVYFWYCECLLLKHKVGEGSTSSERKPLKKSVRSDHFPHFYLSNGVQQIQFLLGLCQEGTYFLCNCNILGFLVGLWNILFTCSNQQICEIQRSNLVSLMLVGKNGSTAYCNKLVTDVQQFNLLLQLICSHTKNTYQYCSREGRFPVPQAFNQKWCTLWKSVLVRIICFSSNQCSEIYNVSLLRIGSFSSTVTIMQFSKPLSLALGGSKGIFFLGVNHFISLYIFQMSC